jgi:1,4-alpha-glucan branching enzyme
MLAKRKLKGGKVRVTFSMPPVDGCDTLYLVGDFNGWSETATPMMRQGDGSWAVRVDLDDQHQYQYRYLANGSQWHNDWAADEYTPNPFGGDNSVLVLANGEKPIRTRKKVSKNGGQHANSPA